MPLDSRPTAEGALQLVTARANDVVEHARLIGGWTLRMQQLSAGPFRSDLTELKLDYMQLIRERTTQALWKEGEIGNGAVIFCVPLRAAGQGYLNGHVIAFPEVVLLDGNNLPAVLTPRDLDVVTLAIDRRWLLESLERLGERDTVDALVGSDRHHCIGVDRAGSPLIRDLLIDLFESCDHAQRALRFLQARQALQEELLLALSQTLVSPARRPLDVATPQKRRADRARELLLAHVDEPPSIADLCKHLGVSRRSLQVCFQDAVGMAPAQFLRAARLNAVRRELRALSETGSRPSIGDVAARWGFWHWSRFAAHYRMLFGELPSDTCRRDAIRD
ncbi:helix-turn-helix domain-containing protein [Bradyrhizobium liaoningense]|uniref:helix-turn-helix domain-containing protein n=1 Tax=Bradyrhizobium liaoningense TaxID=43992 RepID=UPI001BAB9170|nr:helix-turn-helix domain-containing protein [Bradyrhizobium liaoningense]MBR0843165.1 helix-turn-helix domain-containing protein [Bradyrhizobium liaoningense]